MKQNSIIEDLKWRYAVKKFNSEKLNEEDINTVLEACNLTPTSLGLQPYKMVLIDDKEIIKSLEEITYKQESVQTCSHLLILCGETEINNKAVEDFISHMAVEREIAREDLVGYENMCKSFVNSLSEEKKVDWVSRQVYIVLGNLLAALSTLKIDSCPMEGFNPDLLDKALELDTQGLRSVLIVPMGYRSEDDLLSQVKKVRKPINEMVVKIQSKASQI